MLGGVIASACLDAKCRALLTGHISALIASEDIDDLGDDDDVLLRRYDNTVEIPIVAGGSLIAGTDSAKFVLEVHAAGDDYGDRRSAPTPASASRTWSPSTPASSPAFEDDDGGVLPLPLFALSGRLAV